VNTALDGSGALQRLRFPLLVDSTDDVNKWKLRVLITLSEFLVEMLTIPDHWF